MKVVARRSQGGAQAQNRRLRSSPRAVAKPTVLCVDEYAPALGCMKRTLDRQGINALIAPSAAGAMELFSRVRFDAMIIDLDLKDRSGLELITSARRLGIDAPAIVYTGYPNDETKAEADHIGARYVSKHDVRVIELIEVVRAEIEADAAWRETAREQESFFDHVATDVGARQASDAEWREAVSLPLVRVLVDASTPFTLFLATAESFLVLMRHEAAPGEASAFIRVQAQRCYARAAVARGGRLNGIVELVEQAGPGWHRLRPVDARGLALRDADADHALRMVGWSVDHVICGAALHRAVSLVAHTREQVAQIGYQLGFEQPPLFGRFFRRFLGRSPGQFRELVRRG